MTTYVEIGNTTYKVARPPDFAVERYDDVASLLAAVTEPAIVAPTGQNRAVPGLPVARWIQRGDVAAFVAGTYDHPETLGLDRILNLLGLDGDGVVVSCGTAITVDAIVDGRPRWGAILPGFQTAAEGLHARVPVLPVADLAADPHLPARSTEEALAAGILIGTAAAVRELVDVLVCVGRASLPDSHPVATSLADDIMGGRVGQGRPTYTDEDVVLTGGDAPLLARLWGGAPRIDDALLFRGMARLTGDDPGSIAD